MLYSTQRHSGGCLNPALALGLSLLGVMPLGRCLTFCVTDLIAALCAAAALAATGATSPKTPPYGCLGAGEQLLDLFLKDNACTILQVF